MNLLNTFLTVGLMPFSREQKYTEGPLDRLNNFFTVTYGKIQSPEFYSLFKEPSGDLGFCNGTFDVQGRGSKVENGKVTVDFKDEKGDYRIPSIIKMSASGHVTRCSKSVLGSPALEVRGFYRERAEDIIYNFTELFIKKDIKVSSYYDFVKDRTHILDKPFLKVGGHTPFYNLEGIEAENGKPARANILIQMVFYKRLFNPRKYIFSKVKIDLEFKSLSSLDGLE